MTMDKRSEKEDLRVGILDEAKRDEGSGGFCGGKRESDHLSDSMHSTYK